MAAVNVVRSRVASLRFPTASARRSTLLRHSMKPPSPLRRSASTSSQTGSATSSGLKGIAYGSALAISLYVSYLYATDTRASFHRWLVPPLLRLIYPSAEDAHHAGTRSLKLLYSLGLNPRERGDAIDSPKLLTSVFGTEIANPIGISAGLDKDAEIPDALFALGPGIVEVGGCTPLPQPGNPKPRVFRVPFIEGMINRYGLNSHGADEMAIRLRERLRLYARSRGLTETEVLNGQGDAPPGSLHPGRLLAVQIAKNKDTNQKDEQAVAGDHVYCVQRLAPYADILVVNVSSPNTPGLRELQGVEPLTRLLSAVVGEAVKTDRKERPKVMVKVSPDEDEDGQIEGIVQAVHTSGVDGIIVGNTTKRRSGIVAEGVRLTAKEQAVLMEEGGYSGPGMFERTLDLVKRYRSKLDSQSFGSSDPGKEGLEQKVIFATGGITNGEQALQVLNAGASIAMIYTSLVYGGAGTVTRIKEEMKTRL